MSWNMCGSQRDRWNCAGTGTPAQKIGVVRYHVLNNYVQAALLQEVCEDDLAQLMDELGARSDSSFQPYQWSQAGVRRNSRCGNDDERADRIGTAVVIKAGKAVFGGDLNSRAPDDPDNTTAWVWPANLYSTGPGSGGYLECDQAGTVRADPT